MNWLKKILYFIDWQVGGRFSSEITVLRNPKHSSNKEHNLQSGVVVRVIS